MTQLAVPPPATPPAPLAPAPGNGLTPNGTFTPPGRRLLNSGTVLGRLQLLAALIIMLAIVSLVVSWLILSSTASNFRQVVTRITPSIDAVERLGESIEEMDARAAEYQLTSRIDVTSPDFRPDVYGDKGLRTSIWLELERRRVEVDNALTLARDKVNSTTTTTDGDRIRLEKEAINRISNRFYDYFARIGLMRYELDLGRKEAALANYKAAQDILTGNLGAAPLDAQLRSREKVLKDNNWQPVNFTCAVNCPPAEQDKAVRVTFDRNANFQGISANIQLLSVLNNEELESIAPPSDFNSVIVIITAGLLLAATVLIGVYYAFATHRILNFGFLLAMVGGLVVAWLLVGNLYSATQDYKRFTSEYTRKIVTTSAIRQVSADASADISRLLLSPSSPGLDSTNPVLTTDVKRAFDSTTLLAAFNNKTQLVNARLAELDALPAVDTTAVTAQWQNYLKGVGKDGANDSSVIGKFQRRLLADAINSYIGGGTLQSNSARAPYEQFVNQIKVISDNTKRDFDDRACAAIGTSEFVNVCNDAGGGYLNFLQIVVWVAFPLLTLLIAFGVWSASRLF